MKKKNLMIVMLVAVLAFALGMGTLAYYKKEFTSNDNVVRAAKFEVDSNGTLDEEVEFDLTDAPIFPGFKDDVYNFEIDKKGTEVSVKYEIEVTPSGELFENVEEGTSPVKAVLYRETEEGWDEVDNKFKINQVQKDTEEFKIKLVWDHSDYDIEYQNKTGKIAIKVVATQVDEPEIKATFRSGFYKEYGWVSVDVKNLEGAAKFDVTYNASGEKYVTTKIVNIGEESERIFYNGENNVVIRIYDEQENLLYIFKDVKLQ